MKITRFSSAPSYQPEKDWKRVSLCGEEEISIEHFIKPPGHASPLHSHSNIQVLVVLEGKLSVYTEADGEIELEKGDSARFAPDEAHVVTNPLDRASSGIDIFVPGRSFDFWLERNKG